ncbi:MULTISPECIES: GNAT family N-acetyltransferase [unclassified Lysinibacillus]|uniref:GNAT family N-acetyltransferase n=1 Tax=unclassified Lysinibacillus TaxID=2636778 RepID=UPI003819C960
MVGWLVFLSPNRKRLALTGSFGMMVRKDQRGQGIGKRLIGELLTWRLPIQ